MSESSPLPKPALILIALVQGLLALFLYEALRQEHWPFGHPQWLIACFTLVLSAPLFLLLSIERDNWHKVVGWIAPFSLLIGVLGYYIGGQALPLPSASIWTLTFAYALTMSIACFKALMYTQQHASGRPVSYSQLFQLSWRNFLTLGLSLVFVGAFWGILMLWAALFKVIKINFFYDLFTDKWFLYPVLSMANGFGIIIFRNQSKVIDTITRIQQALMKFLLLILVLIAIIFLCALPFTGLAPLWETKTGSTLILWMQALILFFLNAVYQDDVDARPYPLPLHRFVYLGVALLPIYSAISLYGLQLRIVQYGWTVERCWGIVIWAVFALFSLGYLWGIAKQRDRWITQLSWVNIRMGLLVMAVMLLANSPLLDFRKISVASQMSRLNSGAVTLERFDYAYFSQNLARPGYEALQKIKQDVAKTQPEIAEKIAAAYRNDIQREPIVDPLTFAKTFKAWPEQQVLPQDLLSALYQWSEGEPWRFRATQQRYVFKVDLNIDGVDEYVVLLAQDRSGSATLFRRGQNGWDKLAMQVTGSQSLVDLAASISQNRVSSVVQQWHDLQVGDQTLRVQP